MCAPHASCAIALNQCADPLHLVHVRPRRPPAGDANPSREGSPDSPAQLEREKSIRSNKRRKFVDCLTDEDVNMGAFYDSKSKILNCGQLNSPAAQTGMVWHTGRSPAYCMASPPCTHLSTPTRSHANNHGQGYFPLSKPARSSTLSRKRKEYHDLVEITFARGREALDQQIWHQIEIDVPRTRPGVRLWMHAAAQRVRVSF